MHSPLQRCNVTYMTHAHRCVVTSLLPTNPPNSTSPQPLSRAPRTAMSSCPGTRWPARGSVIEVPSGGSQQCVPARICPRSSPPWRSFSACPPVVAVTTALARPARSPPTAPTRSSTRMRPGLGLGLVPEHGQGRRQLQQRPHRRAGLLDQRRPGPAASTTKFQTAISAKKGAPDVVMLEADQLVGFEIQDALVDLAPFGADYGEEELQRGRLEGRLAGHGRLRHPGRRRSDGPDLPH